MIGNGGYSYEHRRVGNTVYVDDDWGSTTPNTSADAGGTLPASVKYKVNAFNNIPEAINALPAAGGTVVLLGNTTSYSAAIRYEPVTFQFVNDTVTAGQNTVNISGALTLTNTLAFSDTSLPAGTTLLSGPGVTFTSAATMNGATA